MTQELNYLYHTTFQCARTWTWTNYSTCFVFRRSRPRLCM